MRDNISHLIKNLGRNKVFKLIGVVVVLIGIPVGVFLVSKIARFEAPALVEPIDIYFTPSSQVLPPDSVFRIMANARSNSVVFAKVVFTFDKNVANLESEITLTPQISTVIRKSTRAEANANGRVEIVFAVPPSQTPPTGIFELANFTLGQVNDAAPGSTSLDFANTQMQVVNINSEVITLQTTSASIGAPSEPTQAATPTPTSIPVCSSPALCRVSPCPVGYQQISATGCATNEVCCNPLPPDEGGPTPTSALLPTPTIVSTEPTITPTATIAPTTAPTSAPTATPLPGCSVTLFPLTITVGYRSTVNLSATVTTQGGAVVNRVVFSSSSTSIASVSPTQDYSYPYQTVLTGNNLGTTTARAQVYIVGRTTVACQDTSSVSVFNTF